MSFVIMVTREKFYGLERFLPVGDNAHTLAEIAGTKTLTPRTLDLAIKLGAEVVVKHGGPYKPTKGAA